MLKQDVLKTMGMVVKGVMKVAGAVAVTGLALIKMSETEYNVTYNDVVKVIMDSNMWTDDKVKAITALKLDAKSEQYLSIIKVVNSSMLSSDKTKLIVELCRNTEEA